MRATRFEFERRFWIIGLIFWAAFALSAVDHANVTEALIRALTSRFTVDRTTERHLFQAAIGAGAALVFAGALLRTWATAYLRTEVVHDTRQHSDTLVADGPYRYVRNPLYLANLPLAAGIGVLASRVGWVFLVAAIWLFVTRLIGREEQSLLETQGESYRAYRAAVPKLWPAITPRVPPSGTRPHWGQAFVGEIFCWMFGAGVLAFAITLRIRLTLVMMATGFALYFAGIALMKRDRRAAQRRA